MSKLKKTAAQNKLQLKRMVELVVSRFSPDKIILFGSHARGNAKADSDIDLLIVMPVKVVSRIFRTFFYKLLIWS